MIRLALETSTEVLSVALSDGTRLWSHSGPGGAQSSATLLPAVRDLLAQAGLPLSDIGQLAFGRGPGSFTGLRTACSVAQGLAFGLGLNLLPIDTLLALAQQARMQQPGATRVWALLDARMGQIYSAAYQHNGERWLTVQEPSLMDAAAVASPDSWENCAFVVAGHAHPLLTQPLPAAAVPCPCWPTAQALLGLMDQATAEGLSVPPALALPLYVRDKVAQTTQERERIKASQLTSRV